MTSETCPVCSGDAKIGDLWQCSNCKGTGVVDPLYYILVKGQVYTAFRSRDDETAVEFVKKALAGDLLTKSFQLVCSKPEHHVIFTTGEQNDQPK